MLDALTQRLSNVVKTLRGHARLTEDNVQEMLREVRLALLDADAGLPVVKDFVARVKEKALGQEVVGSLTPGQALVGVVYEELVKLMGGESTGLDFATQPPAVILLAGLQGSGKTTSAGKLARLIRDTTKRKVLMVSTDVYRPAAIDQLATLAKSLEIDLFPSDPSQKPVDIARNALDWAKKHYHDTLIVDTAGRLAIDEAMMEEVKQLHAALKPIETLFVVDSMQGQDAVNVARAFNEALPLTGIVLTKLDGDSRGGAALSVRHVTGKPIKFVGVSEKMDGLEAFHPDRMASRILGMGDVVSLVERAAEAVDIDEAKKLEEKMRKGQFTLEDFLDQMRAMKKLGSLEKIVSMLPGAGEIKPEELQKQEKEFKRMEGIICAMTPQERRTPQILNAKRRLRIAGGSGVKLAEVNTLMNKFAQMLQMMKKFGKMQKMMGRMGGTMPGMPR